MRRGLVLNVISNVVFFIAGYAIHYFLGNTMMPAEYGIVGTIMTVLDFEYMFLSNGARQSLAKEISMRRFDIGDVIRKSILFQLILVLLFFCINFFGAPLFSMVLNDQSLEQYFRIAAFLVPANGLFVLLLGINDGIQRFGTSALLNTVYPLAKLGVIPLIIYVFRDDPVAGVEIGYLLALVFCIVLGLLLMVRHRSMLRSDGGGPIRFRVVAHNTLSFSFFFIMVSLVLSIDTLIVKSTVEPAAMTGYYTGAVNFGKISYYLMTAFFTVILPVVAKDMGSGHEKQAVQHVREFIVLIGAFVLPIPVAISASSASLLAAFYQPDYQIAAPALSFLSFSSFFMGMTVLLNMVLTSFVSTNRFSDVLSIVSLLTMIPAFVIAARHGGINAIAATSMVCTALTMLVSLWAVTLRTGNIITSRALLTLGANLAFWVIVHVLFTGVLHSIGLVAMAGAYALLYAVYVGALLAAHVVRIPRRKSRDNGGTTVL